MKAGPCRADRAPKVHAQKGPRGVGDYRVLPRCYPGTRKVVGATGFEPATPCAQGRCATRLRYAPTLCNRQLYVESSGHLPLGLAGARYRDCSVLLNTDTPLMSRRSTVMSSLPASMFTSPKNCWPL